MLRVRGLSKRYGSTRALDALDLDVPAGQVALLSGPNGSGKTTLLRLAATLEAPTAGTILVDGLDAAHEGPRVRANIGYAGHNPGLYGELTVRENLRFFGSFYGLDAKRLDARVEAMLAAFHLAPRADQRAQRLSRGLQQRVALARAFLHDPALVLLDEPFTGLDSEASKDFEALLARERHDGRSILLSTHDLALGLVAADRVILLSHGKIAMDEAVQRKEAR